MDAGSHVAFGGRLACPARGATNPRTEFRHPNESSGLLAGRGPQPIERRCHRVAVGGQYEAVVHSQSPVEPSSVSHIERRNSRLNAFSPRSAVVSIVQ